MNELFRAALVIARRDYVASVWSRTFLFFLIGPLFPILFTFVFGSIGAKMDNDATHPTIGVIATQIERAILTRAHSHLGERLGADLPELWVVAPAGPVAAQTNMLLHDEANKVVAVLVDPLGRPRLVGPSSAIDGLRGDLGLLLDEARQEVALAGHGGIPDQVAIRLDPVRQSAGNQSTGRLLTARAGQLVLVLLTTILAGMLLSNLIEEKSNKVIEVLAAAVPVDAIFLGKLIAMLGMSLTGIAVWGSMATLAVLLLVGPGAAGLPPPAIGWPLFVGLGVVYFTASYLLLGAVFLGIGAQASTVREVQTLSMPATMGQLVVFAFASSAVSNLDGATALAATVFPWSSPFAMLARAAQSAALWPHLLAILWQSLWIAFIIRFAARRFRASVLKSGGSGGFFRRRTVKSAAR